VSWPVRHRSFGIDKEGAGCDSGFQFRRSSSRSISCTPAPAEKPADAPSLKGDLAKVDRTIAKEPIYRTKTPKYCLLVEPPA
jgi:hypothetical protein